VQGRREPALRGEERLGGLKGQRKRTF
jgi:hypothetical protein